MKRIPFSLLIFPCLFCNTVLGQIPTNYTPELQNKQRIQYFKPFEQGWASGDPIPFFHNETLHVFYLLFSHEYQNLAGNKNQWSHCSSSDLVNWTHHPLALPITEKWENAMATGSVIFRKDTFYIFYSVFREDENGNNIQYISRSFSLDGIHFHKMKPNQFITPPANYSIFHFRDPHVFFDGVTQMYYMVVTTEKTNENINHLKPSLAYYTSKDLHSWDFNGDMYLPGNANGFYYPECPTLFKWNDWYYLMYKQDGGTYYRISKTVTGPWLAPVEDNIGNDFALVHKVAEFKDNRRIAIGMVPSKTGNVDSGGWQWGGNMVFRELFQNKDGSLHSDAVREMIPESYETKTIEDILLQNKSGFAYQLFRGVPINGRISFDVVPGKDYEQIGILLRHSEKGFYEVNFNKRKHQVSLGGQTISGVYGLETKFSVDIYMNNTIIDVCIRGKRCILNRAYELNGDEIVFYVRNGDVKYENIVVDKFDQE